MSSRSLSLLLFVSLLCLSSAASTPGWQVVSQKWRQKPDAPQVIRWLNFNCSTPFWPVVNPVMSFTLDRPVASGYFLDDCTNNGKPVRHIFPFEHPYLITGFQPVQPATEDSPHVWGMTRQGPRQPGVFNYSEPLYDIGTWSLIDNSGAVLGAVEYEFVFQLMAGFGEQSDSRME